MADGYLAFVLHAHLPFIRHPEYEYFLEERWFFEAMTETYLPLLEVFENLRADGARFPLTLSLSPSLLAMMEDPLLQARYRRHLGGLIALTDHEQERLRDEGHMAWLAGWYGDFFRRMAALYDRWDGRVSQAFRALHETGDIELMTCTATHGLLPLLAARPKTVEAQVRTGLDWFERVMGFRPRGLWLPECAWTPGLDGVLRREGIRYFFLESHGIENASAAPLAGVHAPLYTPEGVAAFGRDRESLQEVWSADEGFPGDGDYREFYRDVGHDLPWDYVGPFIGGDVRSDTGIKYHRITGPTPHKALYDPHAARDKAALHAGEFVDKRVAQLHHLRTLLEAPVVVAPFDAELYGHWWFEGPQWLDFVLRKLAFDQDVVALTTVSGYLDRHPVQQTATPGTSSWGHRGTFEIWLNESNDWIHDHLTECARRLEELAAAQAEPVDALTDRALRQAVRELLLAQASDWPFIIANGTATEYAERRVRDHVARFHHLADGVARGTIDGDALGVLEAMDNPFPDADWRVFAP